MRSIVLLVLTGLMLTGCVGPSAPSTVDTAGTQPRVRKSIVVAQGRQIDSLGQFGETDNESKDMVHAGLIRRNAGTFQEEPWLAEELPSIERGTWKINPDGAMETVYKLRPGIKWVDGTAFHPQDFVFGREVNLDPKVPYRNRRIPQYMDRFDTPDDRTLIIHWNQTYRLANKVFRSELFALPRHLLEPIYREAQTSGDYTRFENNPYWSREYVGTGPYRVTGFEPGVILELEAYEGYFLGRPKIDAITFKLIPDPNVMLTNVLAGELDVTLRSALTFEGGIVAKQQWEARGDGQVHFVPVNWNWVNLSGLNPWFDDLRVRRAFLHAINRQEIVDTLFHGVEPVIHGPMSPRRPQAPRADQVVMKYDFSLARAQALLEEAGWRRGSDGVLVNGRGERLAIEGRGGSSGDEAKLQAATISYWNTIGVETTVNNLDSRVANTEEYRNRWPGANWGSHNVVIEDWSDRFANAALPTENNRWVGNNVSRWSTPEKEAVLQELERALDPRRWEDLTVEFVRLFSLELPHLPLKGSSEVTTVRRGISNVQTRIESGGENSRAWNVHEWEKQ